MIIDYTFIRGSVNSLTDLERQIKDKIADGWQPIGPAHLVLIDRTQQVFVQQMIMESLL